MLRRPCSADLEIFLRSVRVGLRAVSREVWSAPVRAVRYGETGSRTDRSQHLLSTGAWPRPPALVDWVRLRGDGGSGLLGRVHDRGVIARAARPPGSAARDAADRARDHRGRRRELLAACWALSAGRRLRRGGGAGVRDRLGIPADRRADRRLRLDHHDLDRSGGKRCHRLRAGGGADADPARPGASGGGRGSDLVWARGPACVCRDDAVLRRVRCGDPRAWLRRPEGQPRSRTGHGAAGITVDRGGVVLPGGDGACDRDRGAGHGDGSARPARACRPASLWTRDDHARRARPSRPDLVCSKRSRATRRAQGWESSHAASAKRTAITRRTGRSSSTCLCPPVSLWLPPVGSRSWCSSTRLRCS